VNTSRRSGESLGTIRAVARIDATHRRAQNGDMPPLTTDAAVGKLVERLALRFPKLAREQIESTVAAEYAALADSRISTYIPNLVEHGARRRLQHEVHRLAPAA
jgi:hypothetical protein